MKKLIFISLIISGFVFSSCKKKDTTTSGGGGNTSSTSFTNIYGTMTDEQVLHYYPSIPIVDTTYSAMAWFFNAAQNNWMFSGINQTTPAGNVFINSTKLQVFNMPGFILYMDSTNTLNLKTNNSWQVIGSSPIPAIIYSPSILWPSYTGYAQLPDTIHKTQNNIITLSNITGADSVSISINDNSNISGHSYTTGKVKSNTSSITVSSTHTSGLINTANGLLTVSIFKFAPVQNFSSKNFIFIKDVEFQKTVEINNY